MWYEIKHLTLFLKPFAESTRFMSGQSYSTLSGVIILFNVIMDHLDAYRNEIGEYSTVSNPPASLFIAARAAWDKIHKYYNKTNNTHTVVTLLDPRCNVDYFKDGGFNGTMLEEYKSR